MKKLIFLLILLVAVPVMGFAQMKVGYWILTYDKKQGYKDTTTVELFDVYLMAEKYFPGISNCINFENKLKESIQFEMNESGNGCKSFYVEVRKINRKGKFRAMNRKEIKEYMK